MLTYGSTHSAFDESNNQDVARKDSLILKFGAVAVIQTVHNGSGEVTFDENGRCLGSWVWQGTPCHVQGTIEIVDIVRAVVHIIITRENHILFDGCLNLDVVFMS